MTAAAWERQPYPKVVNQEDGQHMCYFHILFYLTIVPIITKPPKMVNRGTITENTENSSKNFRPSSSPRRENGSKHSTILTTKLSTHQTKQPKPFQEATILTVVTSFKQDLKNSQLIIILYGFYVETS
jgi:hypothetical protein